MRIETSILKSVMYKVEIIKGRRVIASYSALSPFKDMYYIDYKSLKGNLSLLQDFFRSVDIVNQMYANDCK